MCYTCLMNTTEYLMLRPLEQFKKNEDIAFSEIVGNDTEISISYKGEPIGSFSLLPYSNGDVYFYEFEIYEAHRGRGIGTMIFPDILNYLYERGYKNIRLQVSSSNPAALAIYNKYNFKVLEAVSM